MAQEETGREGNITIPSLWALAETLQSRFGEDCSNTPIIFEIMHDEPYDRYELSAKDFKHSCKWITRIDAEIDPNTGVVRTIRVAIS